MHSPNENEDRENEMDVLVQGTLDAEAADDPGPSLFLASLHAKNEDIVYRSKQNQAERVECELIALETIKQVARDLVLEFDDLFNQVLAVRANDHSHESHALERLGLESRIHEAVQGTVVKFSEVRELSKLCALVAQLYHPRNRTEEDQLEAHALSAELMRREKPDFNPLSNKLYNKLEAKSYNNGLRQVIFDFKASAKSTNLNLSKRYLADFESMKLLGEFIWRQPGITSVDCSFSKGFESFYSLNVFQALLQLNQLRSVDFNHTKASNAACGCLAIIAYKSKTLEAASLSRCRILDSGAALWGLALHKGCPSLTSLNLSAGMVGDSGCAALALGIARHKTLATLDLSHNLIGRKGLKFLAQALLINNGVVQTLVLDGNRAGSRGALFLSSFLLHNDCKVKTLSLAHNNIGPRGGKGLAVALSTNTSLLHVNFSGNDFGNTGVAPFGVCLQRNRTLLSLDLSSCEISDLGLTALSLGIQVNQTLTSLTLNDQVISDCGCESLVSAMTANPQCALTEISLELNMIRTAGALAFAKYFALPHCVLARLSLSDNEIDDRGAEALATAIIDLKGQTSLKSLNLSGNPIAERVAENYFARAVALGARKSVGADVVGLAIKADGTETARGALRGCGVISTRHPVHGWYYVALMIFTLLSGWGTFAAHVFVAAEQVILVIQTRALEDLIYAIIIVFVVAFNYVYVIVVYSLPETIDFTDDVFLDQDESANMSFKKRKQRTMWQHLKIVFNSRWTAERFWLFLVNATMMRQAYEIFLSFRNDLSTVALASIRLSTCVLSTVPQSIIQLHILFSGSVLNRMKQEGLPGDTTSLILIISLTFSFVVSSSTLLFVFEERFIQNWLKTFWVHENRAYFLGFFLAYVYHLSRYFFRAMVVVLITNIYGPVLAPVFLFLGMLSRLGIWKLTKSSRRKFFAVVSFFVGSGSWDTRLACRLALFLETLEMAYVLVPMWMFPLVSPQGVELLFQYSDWLALWEVVTPLVVTLCVAIPWGLTCVLYFAFIERLHAYSDVPVKVNFRATEVLAMAPFSTAAVNVKSDRGFFANPLFSHGSTAESFIVKKSRKNKDILTSSKSDLYQVTTDSEGNFTVENKA